MNSIVVKAEWDSEVEVWVASSDDVPGLAAEAASLELLRMKLIPVISDLIELNGIDSHLSKIPIVAHQMDEQAAEKLRIRT